MESTRYLRIVIKKEEFVNKTVRGTVDLGEFDTKTLRTDTISSVKFKISPRSIQLSAIDVDKSISPEIWKHKLLIEAMLKAYFDGLCMHNETYTWINEEVADVIPASD